MCYHMNCIGILVGNGNMKKLCIRCHGNGTYLGNGFMTTDCELCNNDIKTEELPAIEKINRTAPSYIQAIKDIRSVHPGISRKEAVRMFDEAYLRG